MADVFVIAAERASFIRSPGTDPGRVMAPAREPSGVTHAVEPGGRSTACGVDVMRLFVFDDLAFPTGIDDDVCPACRDSATELAS